MTAVPVAGYPSKKHACYAMIEQGLDDVAILAATHTTQASLDVYRSQYRLGKRFPTVSRVEQHRKAERIYAAAIDVMAEGCGLSVQEFHIMVRTLPVGRFRPEKPAAPSPLQAAEIDVSSHVDQPSPVEFSQAGEGTLSQDELPPWKRGPQPTIAEPEQETTPVMQQTRLKPMAIEPNSSVGSMVHLKNKETGAYLHLSCEGMTMEKAYRWKGTQKQAMACKRKFDLAASLSMVRVVVLPKL